MGASRMGSQPVAVINDTVRGRLCRLEVQMVNCLHRLETCRERPERDPLWRDIDDAVFRDLSNACGYSWKASICRISSDFGCCEFDRMSRWGKIDTNRMSFIHWLTMCTWLRTQYA